jgi:hypothetical protein
MALRQERQGNTPQADHAACAAVVGPPQHRDRFASLAMTERRHREERSDEAISQHRDRFARDDGTASSRGAQRRSDLDAERAAYRPARHGAAATYSSQGSPGLPKWP